MLWPVLDGSTTGRACCAMRQHGTTEATNGRRCPTHCQSPWVDPLTSASRPKPAMAPRKQTRWRTADRIVMYPMPRSWRLIRERSFGPDLANRRRPCDAGAVSPRCAAVWSSWLGIVEFRRNGTSAGTRIKRRVRLARTVWRASGRRRSRVASCFSMRGVTDLIRRYGRGMSSPSGSPNTRRMARWHTTTFVAGRFTASTGLHRAPQGSWTGRLTVFASTLPRPASARSRRT